MRVVSLINVKSTEYKLKKDGKRHYCEVNVLFHLSSNPFERWLISITDIPLPL